jgi:RNA polymerase-interacting CarD/CdnL/TRCF family regulator
MQLAVGDVVVYAAYGVGRVVAREKRLVLGSEPEVVVLELADGLTVSLPIARANEQLRSLASEADLRQVKEILRDGRAVSTAPWLSRQRESRAKLTEGDPVGLAEIVRDGASRQELLTPKGAKTQLSEGERHLFAKARQLLASEIAQVRGVAMTDADDWIDRQLARTV